MFIFGVIIDPIALLNQSYLIKAFIPVASDNISIVSVLDDETLRASHIFRVLSQLTVAN